jgi:hypothetical protein
MTFPIDEIAMDLRCDARKRCNRKAVFIVSIHTVNDCAAAAVSGRELTPGGDTVWLMCPADLASATWRLGVLVGEMYSDIPDDDTDETVPTCSTCGRPIIGIDDVLTVADLIDIRT